MSGHWQRLAIAVLLLGAIGCRGPRPSVDQVRIDAPATDGEPYRVSARLTNRSSGEGEVEVVVRLIDLGSGLAYQATEKLELDGNEQARVVARVPAPRGRYRADVRAEYPPH